MIVDLNLLPGSTDQPPLSGKFIVNENAIVFFPASHQHKDTKQHGLSYEDGYAGNAVAGTFGSGRIDIRYHEKFSDERIRTIWSQLRSEARLSFLRDWKLYYQGRPITRSARILQSAPSSQPILG